MDAIDTFLDAMFAPYPTTPRLKEAKAELHAMMEDAYGDAIASGMTHNEAVGKVITDFGNLEELAPILGIETELHPGGAQAPATAPQSAPAAAYPPVTLADAQALAEARRSTSRLLATGVSILVLAGAPLVIGTGLSKEELGALNMSEDTASAIAMPLTLIIVAIGVGLLIRRSRSFVDLQHLTEGRFTRDPQVSAWARRLRSEHEGPRSRALTIAVSLWVCSAIPVILLGSGLVPGNMDLSSIGVACCLVLVALGMYIFLPTNWAASTHSTLTEEGHALPGTPGYTREDGNRVIGVISSVYWPLIVAIYFVWGFVFDGWAISWILWPLSGVLFGVLASLINATSGGRADRV